MSATSTFAVGIVGCGRISKNHFDAIRRVDGLTLAAVADIDVDRARTAGELLGVPWFKSLDEMLRGAALNVVCICTPSGLHAAWAAQDPVERYRAFLIERAGFTEQEDDELRAGVKAELGEALRRAEASPLPDAASVADGVYA